MDKKLPWLKLWVEMLTDIKIRMLDVVGRWTWIAVLGMTRASHKAPEIWTPELDEKGRIVPDTEWRLATVEDIAKVANIEQEHWLPRYEVQYQGSFREIYTRQQFMVYLSIEHFKKLDMLRENDHKALTVINFTKRQFFEQDIPRSAQKKNRGTEEQRSRGTEVKKKKGGPGSGVPKTEESQAVYAVYEHWLSVMQKPRSMLTKQRRDKILARLHEGLSVEDLKRAIDGCKASPFHQGENDRQTVYDDIELICRNGSKVEQFINFLVRKGGLRHVGGKPSNRFVAGQGPGAPADDQEAAGRLEELRNWGRDAVPPVPPDAAPAEGGAGPGEGQGAPPAP